MKLSKAIFATFLIAFLVACCGCRKPYQGEVYQEVGTNETAFLVQLEGSGAAKLDSLEAYEKAKVTARRVQITQRWQQTGRMGHVGKWIADVRLIKVDRSPVTREWTADENGTNARDEAIWVESRDSIGFSVGFNCTAYIQEQNAAKFLYFYPAGGAGQSRLAQVMDEEIRNKIQSVAADFAAGSNLDVLREQKVEMAQAIRSQVIPFFAERGITITTVGMFGGLTYENTAIQDAIDNVFVAQQRKNEEAAQLSAMEDYNKRLQAEGQAQAAQKREIAQGEADAISLVAAAEADRVMKMNAALKEAQSNPLFVQIRALEVESERIQAWNGEVPRWTTGGSDSFVPMINISNQ